MKKIVLMLLLILIPFVVEAETYTTLDISLDIDEDDWLVITRGNINDNCDILKKIGTSCDSINSFMKTNDVYVDAINYKNNMELFVVAAKNDLEYNLHNFSDSVLEGYGSKIANTKGIDDYDIYTTMDYKYIYFEYTDSGLYLQEYATAINGYSYYIKIQKDTSFNSTEKIEVQDLIDKITFIYNSKYEKKPEGSDSLFSRAMSKALAGALSAAIIYAIASLFKSKNIKERKKILDNFIESPKDNGNCYICYKCNKEVKYGLKYCDFCGAKLKWENLKDLYTDVDNSEEPGEDYEEDIDENDDFFKEEFEFSYAKVKEVLKKLGYNNYATFKKEVYNSKKIKRKKFDNKEDEINYLVKALDYDDFEDFYTTNIEVD